MNRIRAQTMIAETANCFFATVLINLLSDSVPKMVNLIKFRDAIIFHRVMDIIHVQLHWSKRINVRF